MLQSVTDEHTHINYNRQHSLELSTHLCAFFYPSLSYRQDWANFIPSDLPIVISYDNNMVHIFVVLSMELSRWSSKSTLSKQCTNNLIKKEGKSMLCIIHIAVHITL